MAPGSQAEHREMQLKEALVFWGGRTGEIFGEILP
jgi:hypothetical protein